MPSHLGQHFVHWSNIQQKKKRIRNAKLVGYLAEIEERYLKWKEANMKITGIDKKDVFKKVDLFEEYKGFIDQKKYAEAFDPRGVLHASVLEEFMFYLFKDLVSKHKENVVMGRTKVFEDFQFSPKKFDSMFVDPGVSVKVKDQDFVIGSTVELSFRSVLPKLGGLSPLKVKKFTFVIPALAIECKTYIDRTMLDGTAYAAERMKRGNPLCLYVVVCEYIKLQTREENPKTSQIDEIYILRKQKNVDRAVRLDPTSGWKKQPIDKELVWDFFTLVKQHLETKWWEPRAGLLKGKLIRIG